MINPCFLCRFWAVQLVRSTTLFIEHGENKKYILELLRKKTKVSTGNVFIMCLAFLERFPDVNMISTNVSFKRRDTYFSACRQN